MATYASVLEVRTALARRPTQEAGNLASLSEDALEQCITQTEAEVDGYLRGRYQVPFTPVPALVHSITVDMACWRAALTYYEEQSIESDSPAALRYGRALELLEGLESGKVSLVDQPGDDDGVVPVAEVGEPVNFDIGPLAAQFLDCPVWGWGNDPW